MFIWGEDLERLEHCGTCYTDLGGAGYFVFFLLGLIPLHLRFMAIERRYSHIPLRAVFFHPSLFLFPTP